VPFGPEISWPHGFRQIDPQSRDAFEAAYGPGPAHTGPAYQQPAMDDYDGYGDPGYSDPSYDGPRTSYAGPAFPGGNGDPRNAGGPRGSGGPGYQTPGSRVPGYQVPEVRDNSRSDTSRSGYGTSGHDTGGYQAPGYDTSGYEAGGYEAPGYAAPGYAGSGYQPAPPAARDDIYPVTGAMEALPETGPQPLAPWGDRDGFGKTGTSAYPEQWYDHPRLDDRARDVLPAADPRPADPRPGDPRLEGIRYDELRYDEPASGGTGLDEPLDDDSWYEELRRSAPAYPQTPGDRHPSGPVRQVPSSGQQPGYSPPPATERFGYGQQPRGGSGPQTDRGGSGPQLSAPQLGTGRPRAGGPAEMNTARPTFTPNPGAGFLGAPPAAHVGVLTPPAGSRIETGRIETGRTEMGRTETLPESRPSLASQGTRQFPAAPPAAPPAGSAAAPARQAAPKVRPGHGLDGPMITSSWPAQPATGDVESFEDFWADDDDEAEYKGLFGDRDTSQDGPARRRVPMGRANKAGLDAAKRIGRRRGGSNDHRLWIGLGVVVVLAAAAIVGIIKFEFPSHSGPAHTMQTPASIGTYARTVDLEKEANLGQLRNEVIKMSAGQATDVKSGMYESGKAAAGNTEQIIMFIGGHLANADPASSIAGFKQKYPGATLVNPGSLGGEATCVEEGGGTSESVSMCAWFDNDSFGEIVSPTMNASALAKAMLTVRPAVELVVKK
jgi:hypothetical protein